jgi:hypothetical protein
VTWRTKNKLPSTSCERISYKQYRGLWQLVYACEICPFPNITLYCYQSKTWYSMEYRCEGRKKVSELRGDIDAIRQALTSSFRKLRSSPPRETEPFSQEMHLTIPLSSRGLELSHSNPPGCRVIALHLFLKYIFTNGFLTSSSLG